MKYRYNVNQNNQLLITAARSRKPVLARGRFEVDKSNRLIYWLNEPASWRRIYHLPAKLIFTGNWRLDDNYDLELTLDKTERRAQSDILTIKGNLISASGDTLAFATKSYDEKGLLRLQTIKLAVTWFNDENNRICFTVNKHLPDIITLEGEWYLNKNQQISYIYEKTELKKKSKVRHSLVFEGFWQIDSANKLTYILKGSSGAKFNFRVYIESPNLYPKQGVIKYRLGIGLSQEAPAQEKVISLYGVWKFSRQLGLIFQMDYGCRQIKEIQFGATVSFNPQDEVVFALKSRSGEPLGMSITFGHKFLKQLDAEAFLRLKKSYGESRFDLGVCIPF